MTFELIGSRFDSAAMDSKFNTDDFGASSNKSTPAGSGNKVGVAHSDTVVGMRTPSTCKLSNSLLTATSKANGTGRGRRNTGFAPSIM
ncbi:hypothetical protein B566_EDAN017851 [Ephemera danica]|nr:hypothetical protein B566_EDAN017851 [Ephemera danica]